MAHYAKLDENNIVLEVVVIDDNDEMKNGVTDEETGIQFCQSLFNYPNWKKTSYNNNIRKRYAGIGFTYNSQYDAFIPPKPFNSWLFDEEELNWKAPVPIPDNVNPYYWNENTTGWIIINP